MKKIYTLIALLGLIGTACSNQELEVEHAGKKCVQVTADFIHSRVNFTETDNVTYAYWENGDSITLNTPTQENLKYTATVSETTITFTPDNESLKDIAGETVYACYPASTITNGVVALPATNVWTDAQPLPFAYAVSSIASSKVNLAFDHTFAFLKLTLSAEALEKATTTDGDKTIHRLMVKSASESLAVVSGTFSFEDKSMNITETSDEIELTLAEAFQPAEETERSVYVPILPQAGDVAMSISLIHDHEGGQDVLMEMDKKTPTDGFAAGHVYTLTLTGNGPAIFDGDSGEIYLEEPGLLSSYITDENWKTIKSLKISGYLNEEDLKLLLKMSGYDGLAEGGEGEGSLAELDLANATIMKLGADSLYIPNYTWDNTMRYTRLTKIILPTNIITIDKDAFGSNEFLREITIPKGVITIGEGAFYNCKFLENIILPEEVTTIERLAFYNCGSFSNIVIPNAVTSIGESAFSECNGLKSVTIGKGIQEIGESAFYSCDNLNTVIIDKDAPLTLIDFNAFNRCKSLKEITIPGINATIGANAFDSCDSLTSVTLGKGVKRINNRAFSGNRALKSVTIPEDGELSYIGDEAFRYCSSLDSINLHSVDTISSMAFCESGLTSVSIGKNIKAISYAAFMSCGNLKSVTIPKDAPLTSIGWQAFMHCTSLEEFVIPDWVGTIEIDAFSKCSSLKSITIGKRVRALEDQPFFGCDALETVIIPEDAVLQKIGDYTFADKKLLKSITIPDATSKIGDSAFKNCTSLTEIIIPDQVAYIYNSTFEGCKALKKVTLGKRMFLLYDSAFKDVPIEECKILSNNPPQISISTFSSTAIDSTTAKLYVPAGSLSDYLESAWATYFSNIIEMEE